MFQIHEMTEVHLATFTKREETHGDEKVPAVPSRSRAAGAACAVLDRMASGDMVELQTAHAIATGETRRGC